jgi:hypothetical protein
MTELPCEKCGKGYDGCDCEPEKPGCPDQEEINESICIDQRANLTFTRQTFVRGEKAEEDYEEDGWVAIYGRKEIARAVEDVTLFKKLRDMSLSLGCPRIFAVNDHGNVTEYSYAGKVIGEWV